VASRLLSPAPGDVTRIRSFKDLIAWQRGIQLVVATYEVTRLLPDWERFDLASQMRCAAVSVPSNIAEGHERRSRREYAHYLSMSSGSLAELETHFTISEVVGHLDARQLNKARGYAEEVSRMIWAIERGVRK
jgi:four helix bundle protein